MRTNDKLNMDCSLMLMVGVGEREPAHRKHLPWLVAGITSLEDE